MNARLNVPLEAVSAIAGESESKLGDHAQLDSNGAIGLLMQRAMPNLGREDLLGLMEVSREVEDMAARAAVVANGIACLVMADSADGHPQMGNFQGGVESADLLLHFADSFRQLAALSRLGADAFALLDKKGGAA